MSNSTSYVITCEHGGNTLPPKYSDLFDSPHARRCLASHRGYDPGALQAAQQLSAALHAPLTSSSVSRLLVDLNRSQDSPQVLSEFSKVLTEEQQQVLLAELYLPYRQQVVSQLEDLVRAGRTAIHLSIHTFVPRYRGTLRAIDIGLLFDPARQPETDFCERWKTRLTQLRPRLRVLHNAPYAGTDDGLTTFCRTLFSPSRYYGIEVEINHRYHKRTPDSIRRITDVLLQGLAESVSL